MRDDARAILQAGLDAVEPGRCVRQHLGGLAPWSAGRTLVLGGGKAAVAMAEAAADLLGPEVEGCLNGPRDLVVGRVVVQVAGHPLPTAEGEAGARRMLALARGARAEDRVIVLLSGGASAMLPVPAPGLTLEHKRGVTGALLAAGAPIEEVNTVRKHLSALKGGQLARAAWPAAVLVLVLSDVPGDPLDVIGSGPAFPDPTTAADARAVLARWGLPPVSLAETPAPEDRCFHRVRHVVVGNGPLARRAMVERARALGYRPVELPVELRGEARRAGPTLLAAARAEPLDGAGRGVAVVTGGETTVDLRGARRGRGGRNQELVLACVADLLPGELVASLGSDGVDGASHAAGALADTRIRQAGPDPLPYLRDHDSTAWFERAGGLIVTGPTGTNVADLQVVLRRHP